MKLAYTRLVTENLPALSAFYETLTGVAPVRIPEYVEFHLAGAYLAICSRNAAVYSHGGTWQSAANSSAILEFQVDDVNAERTRLADLVKDWIHEPKDMPWGNRSMLFRDPDGNPINIFAPIKRAA